ncbi:MAG TPA: glycine cleavage system protein H [Terriglobales bacterium]|nr:glycine cleavage system protein H [Terriglobales bacterium]
MTTLFVFLMFLAILMFAYFSMRGHLPSIRRSSRIEDEYGFSGLDGYIFHPGHTWAVKESGETARVGVDGFAAQLLGNIDHIDVMRPKRWVRQGQKLITVTSSAGSFDLLSPVEGVVETVNHEVLQDPTLVNRDPFKRGWVATIHAPELTTNQKNLLHGEMVRPWMHDSVTRLNALIAQMNPKLAQDGGPPVSGLLAQVAPELRTKLIRELFANYCDRSSGPP